MTAALTLLPEVLVGVAASFALLGRTLPGKGRTTSLGAGVLVALAALTAATLGGRPALFGGMLAFDGLTVFARTAVPALTAMWMLWIAGRGTPGERRSEAIALAAFSTLGGMLLVASRDLIVTYMAVELSTMPVYVLVGYRRTDERGLEAALKYFLLTILTSLVLLYGFSFLFGISGATAYGAIDLRGAGSLGIVAAVAALTGLLAKISAAPFHYWAPDAYAGAPAATVAYVSTVPKVAGIAALVRLSAVLASAGPAYGGALAIAAAASMVLGNLAAYPQTDVRRLMAYSGVGHAGYLLVALAGLTPAGGAAAAFYGVAYAVPSMGVMLVAAEEGSGLDRFAGLSSRRPWLAWSTTVLLLSLIGVPPLLGFFGKLYLFGTALRAGHLALVLLALAMSVASAGYYFRIVAAMFSDAGSRTVVEEGAEEGTRATATAPAPSLAATAAILLCVLVTLALGAAAPPALEALGLVLR